MRINRKNMSTIWRHTHSVLFRLLLTFSIVILPIVVTGGHINNQGWEMFNNQTLYSMRQQMTFNITALERQLSMANEQVSQLIKEKESRRYACMPQLMSSYEYASRTNTLVERIQTICNSNDFLHQIELYFPRRDQRLQACVYDFTQSTIGDMDEYDYENMRELAKNWSIKVHYNDGELLGIEQLPNSLAITESTQPWIVSKITYDMNVIHKYLKNILPDTAAECLLISSDGEAILGNMDETSNRVLERVFASIDERDSKLKLVDVSDSRYLIMWCYSSLLNSYYVVYADRASVFAAPRTYRNSLVLLITMSVLALSVYAAMVSYQVHVPLRQIEHAFERLARGEMDFSVEETRHGEFGDLMRSFNQMLARLRQTVQQLYQQRILMQQAQLKQMQAQINPHFLYNSFFILDNMIALEDYEAASMFSKRLGEYFRYVTRDARDSVPLSEEYAHVRSYVDVQLIRFSRRLEVEMPELDEKSARIMVPRLSLQPIVENAFLHSLEHMRGMGRLVVRCGFVQDGVEIEVENNGAEDMRDRIGQIEEMLASDDATSERSGLKNVHQRLLFTQKRGLKVRFEEPDRFVVNMVILSHVLPREEENAAENIDSG